MDDDCREIGSTSLTLLPHPYWYPMERTHLFHTDVLIMLVKDLNSLNVRRFFESRARSKTIALVWDFFERNILKKKKSGEMWNYEILFPSFANPKFLVDKNMLIIIVKTMPSEENLTDNVRTRSLYVLFQLLRPSTKLLLKSLSPPEKSEFIFYNYFLGTIYFTLSLSTVLN